ncbi:MULTISPECIES: restriction endonuclease subunit S [unclassified Kaistella]|uniref:restriction endonuclease subunit S n=1 Tax=unclassified Kaistella TaxID=2762626 RepID=UPI00273374ED|nr:MULTISPECIES: restriction endonuclease subunit S [unclassified Kaistella]MDP2453253.1 restriction endonuclease subunit S [Kaistella sp. SH11-4b]MDP2456310.1 restriction endonuclease subunit S [Kaistella sp. SH40-3]MDP2459066.1 restriction endonuclease subunit S [Kaistella sp. SH19-2b]
MSYKKLGEYIRKVDLKNRDGKILNLQGLSMTKEFRKSTSNIIGTDLSTYKVVKDGQFCCDFMSVIRVHKLPVVLNNLGEDVIISPAYVVFEIKDQSLLLPEYLMMWFRRSEFDRYADFRCDSSIRGGFQWEELCEVELPIPSIEEQRELVKQYHTISDKIKVNEQICEKLETTAQTLYKHWFVDFEFPNEEGKPYKSSGGKMVFNEDLAKEIPEGWKVKEIKEFGKIITGKTPSSNYPEDFGDDFQFITPGDFLNEKIIIESSRKLSSLGCNRLKNKINPKNSILITCIGSDMGKVSLNYEECITNQQINSIVGNSNYYYEYLYYKLVEIKDILKSIAVGGSTMPMLNKSSFEEIKVLKPSNNIIELFHSSILNNTEFYSTLKQQNKKFTQFQSLLLSRLATLGYKKL